MKGRPWANLPVRGRSSGFPPRRIGLPIAGHNRTVRDHLVDHLPKAVFRDLRSYRCGVLVSLRQFRQVGLAAVETGIDSGRQPRLVLAQESLTSDVTTGTVGSEAKRVLVISVLQDQNRLGHVERNDGGPVIILREAGPVRGCPLAVVEQAICLSEYEVVFVPEAIGDTISDFRGGKVVDRMMVGLGPESHDLQRFPI